RPKRRRRDEEDEDDRPRSRRPDEEAVDEDYPRSARGDAYEDEDGEPEVTPRKVVQGWQKVRSGINLVVLGGWIQFAAYVVLALAGIIGVIVMAAGAASVAGSVTTSPTRPPIGQFPGPSPSATPSSGGMGAILGGGILICAVGG